MYIVALAQAVFIVRGRIEQTPKCVTIFQVIVAGDGAVTLLIVVGVVYRGAKYAAWTQEPPTFAKEWSEVFCRYMLKRIRRCDAVHGGCSQRRTACIYGSEIANSAGRKIRMKGNSLEFQGSA